MELADKVAVVTGGGNGIGRALCRRFVTEGARGIVVVDRDADAVRAVADELGDRALGLTADVSVEADIVNVVEHAETQFGPVDLFCSNAGIGGGGGVAVPAQMWPALWAINVLPHPEVADSVRRKAEDPDRWLKGMRRLQARIFEGLG